MKNDKFKFWCCFFFFVVLAFITFRCVWSPDYVFSASDLNIGRLAAKKNNLPEMLTGCFSANQAFGYSAQGFTLFNVLLSALPVTVFADIFYGLVLVFGSMSMVWFLRLWGRSWLASVFGALTAFWFNSIMLAASGHAYKMEVLAFSVLSLCLIEKAVRSESVSRSVGFSLLGGVSVGIMMIEQQDVALLAGLFVGAYAVFRLIQLYAGKGRRWLMILIPVGAVALLLSGSTVMKSYQRNIVGAASVQAQEGKWDYITQWSMVPSEWPDLIASGWSGWGTGNPKGPYWGKLGQSAGWETTKKGLRNFKLTSVYFGIIPFLFGGLALVVFARKRTKSEGAQVLFWGVAGLLGLWLAFGKYSLLYKLFYHLPMMGNIRAPIKFLDNFQLCLGIVGAFGLDYLIRSNEGAKSDPLLRRFGALSLVAAGLLFWAGASLALFPEARIAAFSAEGFERFAPIMVQNMSRAWLHAGVLALVCAVLVMLRQKGWLKPAGTALSFILVLTADSLLLTSHYFQGDDISSLKKGNAVIDYLKQHQENERAFFMDAGGIYNRWLAVDGPYHGLNLFNIWQMPRMPADYKEFLGTVGRNNVRLWELAAVKHIAAPASVVAQIKETPALNTKFRPVLNYQVPTAQGMRSDVILEFTGSIPRFALYKKWQAVPAEQQCQVLVSPQHDPQSTILVAPDAAVPVSQSAGNFEELTPVVTKTSATLQVQTDVPAILRFAQHRQPGWTVRVDGRQAALLTVDYLCMGVVIPAGSHTVEFCAPDARGTLIFSTAVLLITLAGSFVLLKKGCCEG